MSAERQKVIMPRKSRFSLEYERSQLYFFLINLGMRHKVTNQPITGANEQRYIIRSLKEDLGIPRNLMVWLHWFENGSAFSAAKDFYGNPCLNINIGNQKTLFQVSFNKRENRFVDLFFDNQAISFADISHLY
jgi:hypothetical protein